MRNDEVSKRKAKKDRNAYPPRERLSCGKCGNKHFGECLVLTNSFYGCAKVDMW